MTLIKDIINQNKRLAKISKIISELSDETQINAFLVGGCVRDLMLNPLAESIDVDIMVEGDGINFAEKLARKINVPKIVPFKKFATAKIPFKEYEIEVASARLEKYDESSRSPSEVVMSNIEDDLLRRDFTINAMAILLNKENFGEFFDPFNGMKDLSNKILRTPLDSDTTFSDDPLRMMRAAYFASKLSLDIEPSCLESIKNNAERITIVSQERKTNELLKILGTKKPSIGLNILQEAGLMEFVFPEIAEMYGLDQSNEYHHKDIFYHTLEVVDNAAQLSDKLDLRLAALVHDIAKPKTRRLSKSKGYTFYGHDDVGARMLKGISSNMKFSNSTRDYIAKLTALHLRPISLAKKDVTDSAIRRLIVDAGEEIDDLMKLCRADITTKNPKNITKYLGNFDRVEKRMNEVIEIDKLKAFQSPVRGDEIMKMFDLGPGKEVGKIKTMVEDAIINGEISNDYSSAMTFLDQIKQQKK
ncbi:CCA tRNA nucleotidyltransferase [Candidatus Marinimicrobia bacterium]|nr:CCA tRNA nucleotidyltransferase [Candidatus Neomarinimicrobiota bacterium]MDA9735758.1 CCA tRNA nucleotidyltransferase [Candidatus Neomarinimicrobiota bacterium]